MVAGTKRKKLPEGDSSSPPPRRVKRARRSKTQTTKQEEPPSPGTSTSRSSRSPSPAEEFYAPRHPKLSQWRCCVRGCRGRWPLAVRRCEDFIDDLGWEECREWGRWKLFIENSQASGDYDYGIRLTPTSIFVPEKRLKEVSQQLESMEMERLLLLRDGRHDCLTDCYVPGVCKEVQCKFARRSSSLSSEEGSQSPRPAMPDSPKSPPPSDDEDGEDVGWIDVGDDAGSPGTKDEDADLARSGRRLPSPLLPSDGAPEIYEDDDAADGPGLGSDERL
ncbi:unnamed protein product [Clonostachys byssicola]|uniref:Uncharacterized protein n=1 Tax=Clonostachys byssicola TaxID=160290 RepID=A0A9N9Y7L0_9HYPO|nr:unnamed protein product [Clonostachys byssicola]